MKKYLKYLLPCLVLIFLSCNQEPRSKSSSNPTDSVVAAFTWDNIPNAERDTSAVYLNKLLEQDISKASKIKLYADLCYYHFTFKRNLPKGLLYADSLIMFAKKSDPDVFSKELSLGYYSKGDILFALGKYDEAYENYYAAKKVMDAKKDRCTSGDYCYRIAMILFQQGKYEEAGLFFKQGFDETLYCEQNYAIIYREQELLNNVALCFARLNKVDSALISYQKAIDFIDKNDTIPAKKISFDAARGVVYGNMGAEYIKKKDYPKAEELLLRSIGINIRPGYENNDAALTQIKLGKLYLQNDELDKVGQLLESLKVNVERLNNKETTTAFHYLSAFYLNKLGKNDLAFEHLSKYMEMQTSSQSHYNVVRETDIYERFKNLDNQNEIDYLKKEKQLQETYLYITIVFSVMAIVIILLIYFYWKKSRKSVEILTKLNDKISSQKRQLEEAFEDLENSDKEKDSLLRAVAHDLRNPIGGISSLVGLMIEEDTDEDVRYQHQLIKETCLNALSLINELIEAAENQLADKGLNNRTSVDFVKLTTDAIELLKFKAQEKHQQLDLQKPSEPIVVYINRERILRVISNLISNAIKFSYDNTTIKVILTKKGERIEVAVIDSGIGIPLALQPNVFQMFTAAKRSGTNGEKSYGLGLSISKKIINEHRGEIWFKSNDNGGTTFYFSLPLA